MAVRDAVRDHLIGHLGDPQGVLFVDDTGVLKMASVWRGVWRGSGLSVDCRPRRRSQSDWLGRERQLGLVSDRTALKGLCIR